MAVEPIELLMRKILSQYNQKPRGWAVLADSKGNTLILGPKAGYRLRLIPLNPYEYTGVGIQTSGLAEARKIAGKYPSYGFRPMSKKDTKQLLETITRYGTLPQRLVRKILTTKPTAISELAEMKAETVLNGPITLSPDLNTILKGQEQLEKKLKIEAYKLFKQRYPSRVKFYGW